VKFETAGEHCHGPAHRALLTAVAFTGKLNFNKLSLCVRMLCFVELVVLPKVLYSVSVGEIVAFPEFSLLLISS
jgi:hypothetical protein